MSYQEELGAISARIATLKEAAALRGTNGRESFGLGAMMRGECQSIADLLQIYGERYESTLPSAAASAIKRLLSSRPIQGVRENNPVIQNDRSIPEAVTALVMFAGELSYLLADQQPLLRLRSQQAFAHLQRTLAVNKRVREEWQAAFNGTGEVECEQLGGVHLLGQGIYAFKIDTTGAATDLVFNEPVVPGELARISEGLVLTEWKVADDDEEVPQMFEQGFEQTSRLSSHSFVRPDASSVPRHRRCH